MSELRVHQASPMRNRPVESVTIAVDVPLPDADLGSDARRALYDLDAEIIVDALFASLPQGTIERVLAKMIMRRASLYRGTIADQKD
jgi:hypothetical protein